MESRQETLAKLRRASLIKSLVTLLVLGGAAYAFYTYRPDKMLVKDAPNDPIPILANKQPAVSLAKGQFHKTMIDTKGGAAIYRNDSGVYLLRISDFQTEYGPNIHLCMVEGEDGDEIVAGAQYIDVGKLRDDSGNQVYELPKEYDPGKHKSVAVYSKALQKLYGSAPLR